MFSDNEVDDAIKNRKGNIPLQEGIFGKDFFKNNNKDYARNTCIDNKEYYVDISDDGFVGKGSYGVARKGKYISLKDGKIKDGIIKIIISQQYKKNSELNEIKIGIEASKLCPEAVVDIELLNKCDILSNLNIKIDKKNKTKDLIIIGMEEGIPLYRYIAPAHELKHVKMSAIEACDRFNLNGFFHNDIKPKNMIVVKRNKVNTAVLIDFGKARYMNAVSYMDSSKKYITRDFSLTNPPFDSFYLSLTFFKYDSMFFDIVLKYYFILMACGIKQEELETIYSSFNHYNLNNVVYKFYKKVFDNNISLVNIPDVYIKYANNRKISIAANKNNIKKTIIPTPVTLENLRNELSHIGSIKKSKIPTRVSLEKLRTDTKHKISDKNKPVCSPDRKKKNSDDLTLKEAKLLCKKNGIIQTGNKKEICDRLLRKKLVI